MSTQFFLIRLAPQECNPIDPCSDAINGYAPLTTCVPPTMKDLSVRVWFFANADIVANKTSKTKIVRTFYSGVELWILSLKWYRLSAQTVRTFVICDQETIARDHACSEASMKKVFSAYENGNVLQVSREQIRQSVQDSVVLPAPLNPLSAHATELDKLGPRRVVRSA